MRVAFFGTSGEITLLPLQAVARAHDVVLAVRPIGSSSLLRNSVRKVMEAAGLRHRDPIAAFCRAARIPLVYMRDAADTSVVERLRHARPDIICISSFRWLLPMAVVETAKRGAVNLHSALLPRHRGAVPLFWIFYEDDCETGVTVHDVTGRADAGAILGQERWPLARGTTADALNAANAARGAALLVRVLREIEGGSIQRSPQDETLATRAPKVPRSGRMIDFASWPAERVWHFLGGVAPYYVEELFDREGRRIEYAGIIGWRSGTSGVPGTAAIIGGEILLSCRDGAVLLRGT